MYCVKLTEIVIALACCCSFVGFDCFHWIKASAKWLNGNFNFYLNITLYLILHKHLRNNCTQVFKLKQLSFFFFFLQCYSALMNKFKFLFWETSFLSPLNTWLNLCFLIEKKLIFSSHHRNSQVMRTSPSRTGTLRRDGRSVTSAQTLCSEDGTPLTRPVSARAPGLPAGEWCVTGTFAA